MSKIANAKLREAFVASGRSAPDVACDLNWGFRNRYGWQPDGSRLKRALGLSLDKTCGQSRRRAMIDTEAAALIAIAIGVEPEEVGVPAPPIPVVTVAEPPPPPPPHRGPCTCDRDYLMVGLGDECP